MAQGIYRPSRGRLFLVGALAALGLSTAAFCAETLEARSMAIVAEDSQTFPEAHAAKLIKERIERKNAAEVSIVKKRPADAPLTIYIGLAGAKGAGARLAAERELAPPGKDAPAPEGYAVSGFVDKQGALIVAVGADARGVLYATGEILRRLRCLPGRVVFEPFEIRTAPAYRFRGFSANQGGTMMRVTGARGWTEEELLGYLTDYALAGGNCFYTGDRGGAAYDYVKSLGLMSTTGARPNQMDGGFPEEWRAGGLDGWEGSNWVCPSIPEARAALMKQWDEDFKQRKDHDVFRMYAGDPGGCRDERCEPWGKTFVHLCEEVAAIWLKYHPDSIVLIANQDLSNEGDQAIFDYLNERPRPWLYGLAYGPGSNAMSPYFRDELREDLFVYPGHGWVNRYLAETLNQLPKEQRIVHYSDITHWISAQYQVMNPAPEIVKSYGRRTFHARPRAYYKIFQQIMPFSEGDIIYSEGYHDEFHQYMWARLLWDPHRELEDVMLEYCTLHFGAEAADSMVQALFQLEKNLEEPVAENEGIDRYYTLVKQAGWEIPPNLMADDYRWRLHMQKAALDKYIQLKLRIELDKEARLRETLERGLKSGRLDETIAEGVRILEEPRETTDMTLLRDEARTRAEETNARIGLMNVGLAKLDEPIRQIERELENLKSAATQSNKAEKRKLVEATITLTGRPTVRGRIFW